MVERVILPYAFNDLEPYIDTETMEVHYNGHYKAYTDKANALIKEHSSFKMHECDNYVNAALEVSTEKSAVQHNIGGWFNHSFYFEGLHSPNKSEPAVIPVFNIYEFKEAVISLAIRDLRGSGYIWMCVSKATKDLHVVLTQNQEIGFMTAFTPILNIDLWEHAYYLKHQNQKIDYIDDFFEVINWSMVNKRYRTMEVKNDA